MIIKNSFYTNKKLLKRKKNYKIIGRGGEIRTPDPLVPNQMRYQTALRPDKDLLVQKKVI